MGSWLSKIKAVPGIGVFDSAEFVHPDAGWVQPISEEFSGMNRCKWSNTTWADQYAGDNPKSGPELSWTNVELLSIDASNPTTLFGICFGEEPFNGDPILIVKAYRGNTLQTFTVGGFPTTCNSECYSIKCSYFRRVYSDAQNYTESECIGTNFVYQTRILKPSSGTISDIQNYLEFFRWNNDWWFGISSTGMGTDGQTRVGNFTLQWPTGDAMKGVFGDDEPTPSDPTSPEFGPAAKPKGGYNEKSHKKGTFDDHSDQIVPTDMPLEGVSTSGFINVYKCNRQALMNLGGHLFPAPVSFDLYEVIRNRYDMDYVLSCKLVPLNPQSTGYQGITIKVGYHSFNCNEDGGNVREVDSDYVEKDLGSVGYLEYWGNFLDYAGTSAQLFLPFLGFVPLEPEFWNGGGRIHLIFRMNCITGDFVYLIRSTSGMSELDDSLVAQYGGNCSVEIPITGVQAGQAAMKYFEGGLTMGLGAFVGDAGGIANGVQQLCGLRPDVPKSGGITGASGFFGHRRPFLLIKRQDSQFSEVYPEEVGLPYYGQKTLGECHGLTIAKDAHLDTIPANAEVKEMISRLLSEGIIL